MARKNNKKKTITYEDAVFLQELPDGMIVVYSYTIEEELHSDNKHEKPTCSTNN